MLKFYLWIFKILFIYSDMQVAVHTNSLSLTMYLWSVYSDGALIMFEVLVLWKSQM